MVKMKNEENMLERSKERKEQPQDEFGSASMEAKKWILECLQDGEVHERREIASYLKEQDKGRGRLRPGVIAGGFKMLLASGEIQTEGRGMYRKGPGRDMGSLRGRVRAVYERFQRELDRACTGNILGTTEEDFRFIQGAKEVNALIEEKLWGVTGRGPEAGSWQEEPAGESREGTEPGKAIESEPTQPEAREKKTNERPGKEETDISRRLAVYKNQQRNIKFVSAFRCYKISSIRR